MNAVRLPGPQGQAFWSGTESVYSTLPLFAIQPKKVSARASASPDPSTVYQKSSAKKGKGEASITEVVPTGLQLSIQPADTVAQVGKEFRVDVMGKHVLGLETETFVLDFDPQVVEFRDAAQGEVLGAESGKAAVVVAPHSTDGVVELRLHRSASATKDEGRLLRLTFLAKAPGVSAVHLFGAKHAGVGGSEEATEAKGVVRVR